MREIKFWLLYVSAKCLEFECLQNFADFKGKLKLLDLSGKVTKLDSLTPRCRKSPRQRRLMCLVECPEGKAFSSGERMLKLGCKCVHSNCDIYINNEPFCYEMGAPGTPRPFITESEERNHSPS